MHSVPASQLILVNGDELQLQTSTLLTAQLRECIQRRCRGCARCQSAEWNTQHQLFTALLAELTALQDAAAAVEQQLHSTADARFYACTHIWHLHPFAYSAECIRCQCQGTLTENGTVEL
eukprot:1653809-Rhodomonas_salina.1